MKISLGAFCASVTLVLGAAAPVGAQTTLYSITADQLTPDHPATFLKRIDPQTGQTLSSVQIALVNPPPPITPGDDRNTLVVTGNALAAHPQSGQLYAVLTVQSDVDQHVDKRHLAIVDPATGLATVLRDVGQFAALAFTTGGPLGVGTLLGVTDDFATGPFCPPQPQCEGATLYRLADDGQVTLLRNFLSLSPGEALAFNPADLRVYHVSGPRNARTFESLDPANPSVPTTTHIPLIGAPSDELTGLTYASPLFLGASVTGEFFTISPAGVILKIGALDHLTGGLAVTTPPATTSLVAAVLPGSRSVQVPTPATAFATIVNSGANPAFGVGIGLASGIPAALTYRQTDCHSNAVIGADNAPANIAPAGQACYVMSILPSAEFGPTEVAFTYAGINTLAVATLPAINTLLASASLAAVPDMVAVAVTPTGDGILHIPGVGATAAFAAATSNVGSGATITALANTGGVALPLQISICQTDPATGLCISAIGPTATAVVGPGATPTFAVFVKATGAIPLDAATNRVFLLLTDQGQVTRGRASVAVTAQ